MYFIRKEEDLWDKTIAFTHFARFADAILIVTKDKGICVVDKDDEEIELYNPLRARDYILKQDFIRDELNALGIITKEDIEEYQREQREKRKKEEELRKQQQEENEYKQYLELKEKYEGKK